MTLSFLEAMTIFRSLGPNLDYLEHSHRPEDYPDKDERKLRQWLDALSKILAVQDGCAISLSVDARNCLFTVAFNSPSPSAHLEETGFITSVWDWLQSVQNVARIGQDQVNDLAKVVFRFTLPTIRKRLKEDGWSMDFVRAELAAPKVDEDQLAYLKCADNIHMEFFTSLGPSAQSPFDMDKIQTRVKHYEAAKAKFIRFGWLYSLEKSFINEPGGKCPSLLHYIDQLLEPYYHILTIIKLAKRTNIQPILTKKLVIDVLPSFPPPVQSAFQSMDGFDARVRMYLADALNSYSPVDMKDKYANSSINKLMERIYTFLQKRQDNQFDPPSVVHCECALLHHHIRSETTLAYFGISEVSCFQCGLYFQAYKKLGIGRPFQTRGSDPGVFVCALPTSGNIHDRAIETDMSFRLKRVIGELVSDEIDRQHEERFLPGKKMEFPI